MIGFFVKKPAIGVLALLLVGGAGGLMAHHRAGAAGPTASLSLARRVDLVRPAARNWRSGLDLDKARWQRGKLVQDLEDGLRVTYSIDQRLQAWAIKYLKSYEVPYSGMVLLDLRTARVLVMTGQAADNPRVSTRQLCLTPWAPAASVYKLVTAAALLDRGVSPEASVCYHGGSHGLAGRHITDDRRRDGTCNTLSYAIAKSVNPIMGKLALRHLSPQDMEEWSYRFGFNRPIPFDIPVQPSKATIPVEDLARARVAAGFWKTELSVLHGALIAAVAASRGLLLWPSVVESVRWSDGRLLRPEPPEPERVMSRSLADKLAAMMVATTTMGTGMRAFHDRRGQPFMPRIEVGGKTGSLSRQNPFLHYSWFVGFAPAIKPTVAFAVLLGNPAKWKIKANVAARELLTRYFNVSSQKSGLRQAAAGAPPKRTARRGKSPRSFRSEGARRAVKVPEAGKPRAARQPTASSDTRI